MLLVVTPLASVTVHAVALAIVALPAVNVNVAVDVPDPVPAAVNVVVPHPAFVTVSPLPNVNVGTTTATLSPTATTAFAVKLYDTALTALNTACAIDSVLTLSATATSAGDVVIVVAAMLLDPASVNATVRVAMFAA